MLTADYIGFMRELWRGASYVTYAPSHTAFNFRPKLAGGQYDKALYTVEEAVEVMKAQSGQQHTDNLFTPVGYVNPNDGKKKRNIGQCRALWVDCDYKDYEGGETEANARVQELLTAIPASACFASGNGLHIYWLLDSTIPLDRWYDLARIWQKYIISIDATRDAAASVDPVKVMRVPGMWTTKHSRIVEGWVMPNVQYTVQQLSELCAIGGTFWDNKPAYIEPGEAFDFLTSYKPVALDVVIENCEAVAAFNRSMGEVKEPEWFVNAGMARYFEDGDAWFHKVSSGDYRYSFDETESKLEAARQNRASPPRCEEYRLHRSPACRACPLSQYVESPYEIPAIIDARAKPQQPVTVDAPVVAADGSVSTPADVAQAYIEEDKIASPDGFERDGITGLVYKSIPPAKKGAPWDRAAIFNFPIRFRDVVQYYGVQNKKAVRMEYYRLGEWLPLEVPTADVSEPRSMAKALARQGALCATQNQQDMLNSWVRASYNAYIEFKYDATLYTSMGWTEEKSFVLGDLEYGSDFALPGRMAKEVTSNFKDAGYNFDSQGTLDEWRQLVRGALWDPQLADRRALFAMAFAAPLVGLTAYESTSVIMRGASGTGKSLVMQAQSSIYGKPTSNHLTVADTDFGRMHRIASMGAVPVMFDEMSRLQKETAQSLLFEIAQGRTKEAGTKDGTTRGLKRWRTIMFGGTNQSMTDLITSDHQASASGEAVRMLEVYVDKLPVATDVTLPTRMAKGSYGIAGHQWVEYVVKHRQDLEAEIQAMGIQLMQEWRCPAAERFWVSLLAATTLVAVNRVTQLGIIDFDVAEIKTQLYTMVMAARYRLQAGTIEDRDLLETFINEHADSIAIAVTPEAKPTEPKRSGGVVAQIVKHQGYRQVAVRASTFNKWMGQRRADAKSFLVDMKEKELLVSAGKAYRLTRGLDQDIGPVRCHVFKIGNEI